jgi:hypothetical protein
VESPRLKRVFFILRNELKQSDIPGRSSVRNYIMDRFREHLIKLEGDMKVRDTFLPSF